MRFKLLFDIEPVEQARPRARKLRQGIMMYDPAKVKNFKRRLHDMAKYQYHGEPLTGELSVKICFYRAVQNSISKIERHRRLTGVHGPTVKPDLDNYIKSTLDALNGVLWKDDNLITTITAHKKYAEQPRIEIEVEEK